MPKRLSQIPASLEAMQQWFARLITSPIVETDGDQIPTFSPDVILDIRNKIAPSPTLKSEERFGIYQQQYWWRLISVMQDLFPTLVSIFDYEEFNRLIAEPYLASHIPHDWFISNIGAELPDWLMTTSIKNKRLLKELALLDLAYEQLLFANILPPPKAAKYETETLYLQPFVLLFEMTSDLFSLRMEILKEKKLPLKKERRKTYMVLYRLHEESLFEELDPIVFKLLLRLQKGACLNELIPLLEKCEDVSSLFQTISSRGWLTQKPTIDR